MNVLIVKTSSLGDIIFALPVATAIKEHYPDAHIDWVSEEAYCEFVSWNKAIERVIPVAHRRWSKSWLSSQHKKERQAFKQMMQEKAYDVIFDLQGLFKSLWVARQAKGPIVGFDASQLKERIAAWFYKKQIKTDPNHGIASQMYEVVARYFNWPDVLPTQHSHGFDFKPHHVPEGERYFVLMPSNSKPSKSWDIDNWQRLTVWLIKHGYKVKIFSGNDKELAYAQEIAQDYPEAEALSVMPLEDIAQTIISSEGMIGLDSGLTHMAAALGRPTIGIYCDSPREKFRLIGSNQTYEVGNKGAPPSLQTVISRALKIIHKDHPEE